MLFIRVGRVTTRQRTCSVVTLYEAKTNEKLKVIIDNDIYVLYPSINMLYIKMKKNNKGI